MKSTKKPRSLLYKAGSDVGYIAIKNLTRTSFYID